MTKEQVIVKIREMLKSTNELSEEEYIGLVEKSHSLKNKDTILSLIFEKENFLFVENNQDCFNILCEACNEYYLRQTHLSYNDKRILQSVLQDWIDRIKDQYSLILDFSCIEELSNYVSKDVYIEFVKAFHNEQGVSSKELQALTKMSQKTINLWVKALNNDKETKRSNQRTEIRIGGQLVNFEIKEEQNGHYKLYKAENTVHPIVFQNNLMQVIVMLKAFQDCNNNNFSDISRDLAINTWVQLSDYAKQRIIALNDAMHYLEEDFLEDLIKNSYSKSLSFLTEKEISKRFENSVSETILMALKSGREVSGITETGKLFEGEVSFHGDKVVFTPSSGPIVEVYEEDVREVHFK